MSGASNTSRLWNPPPFGAEHRPALKTVTITAGESWTWADPCSSTEAATVVRPTSTDKDRIPVYITWEAQLKAAQDDRDFTRDSLLIATETAPILLGIKGQGAHDAAYKTVKVQAMNSLKKGERKALIQVGAIRRLLSVAQDLECAAVPGYAYARGPIGVTLNDGFPNDDLDQATTLATLRGADLISLERAVRTLLPDPAAADAELEELADEAKVKAEQATPPIVFGAQMPGATTGVAQVEGGQATAAAVAAGDASEEVAE